MISACAGVKNLLLQPLTGVPVNVIFSLPVSLPRLPKVVDNFTQKR